MKEYQRGAQTYDFSQGIDFEWQDKKISITFDEALDVQFGSMSAGLRDIQLMYLKATSGLSWKEIAPKLDISEQTAKNELVRLRQNNSKNKKVTLMNILTEAYKYDLLNPYSILTFENLEAAYFGCLSIKPSEIRRYLFKPE